MAFKWNKLGRLLVEEGIISAEQLNKALESQTIFGGRLGTNLVELSYLTLDVLANFLALQKDCPNAGSDVINIVTQDLLGKIPAPLCEKYNVFPLFVENEKLMHLAMCDPTNLIKIDELSFVLGLSIQPWSIPELRLYYLLEKYLGIVRDHRFLRLAQEAEGVSAANYQTKRHYLEPTTPSAGAEQKGQAGNLLQPPAEPPVVIKTQSSEYELVFLDEVEYSPPTLPKAETGDFEIVVDEPEAGADPTAHPRGLPPALSKFPYDYRQLSAPALPSADRGGQPALKSPSPSDLLQSLDLAENAKEIATLLVQPFLLQTDFAVVFMVRGEFGVGLSAMGTPATDEEVRRVAISLAMPSLLQKGFNTRSIICGKVQGDPLTQIISACLFSPSVGEICVVPIIVKERVINLLYLLSLRGTYTDNDVNLLRRISQHAAATYIRLIKQQKLY